jgi:hypothetical protein
MAGYSRFRVCGSHTRSNSIFLFYIDCCTDRLVVFLPLLCTHAMLVCSFVLVVWPLMCVADVAPFAVCVLLSLGRARCVSGACVLCR